MSVWGGMEGERRNQDTEACHRPFNRPDGGLDGPDGRSVSLSEIEPFPFSENDFDPCAK